MKSLSVVPVKAAGPGWVLSCNQTRLNSGAPVQIFGVPAHYDVEIEFL